MSIIALVIHCEEGNTLFSGASSARLTETLYKMKPNSDETFHIHLVAERKLGRHAYTPPYSLQVIACSLFGESIV